VRGDARDVYEDKWTVSEKIELILKAVAARESLKFSDLFEGALSRSEVVVTFLALLELIRLKQLAAVQTEAFGVIEIRRVSGAPVPPPEAATPAADKSN
jgi:segregation and condensation protein A